MPPFLIAALSSLIAAVITWAICKAVAAKSATALNIRAASLQAALSANEARSTNLEAARESDRNAIAESVKTVATLQEQLRSKDALLAQSKVLLTEARADMEREFRLIAQVALEQQSQRLGEQQGAKLQDLLRPFSEQIDGFRKASEERFATELADRNSLKGELTKMMELNQSISAEAHALTTALTKNTKQQGDFGEAILETILSNAGMIEGEHYYRQYSAQNEAGSRIRPDVVLRCPGGYHIVVDSKVSLTHYVRYCTGELSPEEEKKLRKDIWQSFKAHVDGLSAKKYERIPDAADFVLLFTPVEAALSVAFMHDAELRHYAYGKKVFFVTPSNLLLVIKMIGDLWQKDRINQHAEEMAERAKLLHDKACLFLESFMEMGAALDGARSAWVTAQSRLSGHGGLVSQGALLQKLLDKKAVKRIPSALLPDDAVPEVAA